MSGFLSRLFNRLRESEDRASLDLLREMFDLEAARRIMQNGKAVPADHGQRPEAA